MKRTPTFSLSEMLLSLLRVNVLWQRLPTRRVYLKQVYFSGLQSLPLVLLVGAAVSGIIVDQLRSFGESPKRSMDILLTITLNELAPLLTAFLMAARSAPAMASELATMQVNGEVRLLLRLGVPPLGYLVIPRIAAMATGSVLLTIYFAFAAMFAGSAFAAQAHMFAALASIDESMRIGIMLLCIMKSLLFGITIALVACHTGLAAGRSFTDVPIAASRAVVRALACVFILDLLLVAL